MRALLVVDIQNDFVAGGALEVKDGSSIIPLVNRLQHFFGLVVATQDWHPEGHKSFASSHDQKKPFEEITLNGLHQVLWPDHCIQGSPGASFCDHLDLTKAEAIIRKGMDLEIDSYSGFYENGHRRSTGLAGYLHERRVAKVYICGLAADYCVFYSAKDALKEKFDTYVIEDATRAISADGFAKAKEEIIGAGGHVIQSSQIFE